MSDRKGYDSYRSYKGGKGSGGYDGGGGGGGGGGKRWGDWGGKKGKGAKAGMLSRVTVWATQTRDFEDQGVPVPVPGARSQTKQAGWTNVNLIERTEDEVDLVQPRNRLNTTNTDTVEDYAITPLNIEMKSLSDPAVVVPQVLAEISQSGVTAERAIRIMDLLRHGTETFCTTTCLNRVVVICKAERKPAPLLEVFKRHDGASLADAKTCKMLGDMCRVTACPDVAYLALTVALLNPDVRVRSSDPYLPHNTSALRRPLFAADLPLITQIVGTVFSRSSRAYRSHDGQRRGGLMTEHGGVFETHLTPDQQRYLVTGTLLVLNKLKEATNGKTVLELGAAQKACCLSWLAHLGISGEAVRMYVAGCAEDEMEPLPLDDVTLDSLLAAAETERSIRLAEKVIKKIRILKSNELAVQTPRLLALFALLPDGVVLDKTHFSSHHPYSATQVDCGKRFHPATHIVMFRQMHAELLKRRAATPLVSVLNVTLEALTLYYAKYAEAKLTVHGRLHTRTELMQMWEQSLGPSGVLGNRDTVGRGVMKGCVYALCRLVVGELGGAAKGVGVSEDAHAAAEAAVPAMSDFFYLLRQLVDLECYDCPEALTLLHSTLSSGVLSPPTRGSAQGWPLAPLLERMRAYNIDDWAIKTIASLDHLNHAETLPAAVRCCRWTTEMYSKAVAEGGDEDDDEVLKKTPPNTSHFLVSSKMTKILFKGKTQTNLNYGYNPFHITHTPLQDDAENALLALLDVEEEKQAPASFFNASVGEALLDDAKYLVVLDVASVLEIFAKPTNLPKVTPPGTPPPVGVYQRRFLGMLASCKDMQCVVPFSTLMGLADLRAPEARRCLAVLMSAFSTGMRIAALPLSASYDVAMAPHRFRPRKRRRLNAGEISSEPAPPLATEADRLIAVCHKLQGLATIGMTVFLIQLFFFVNSKKDWGQRCKKRIEKKDILFFDSINHYNLQF